VQWPLGTRYGIRTDTLDNPGWSIQIDLRDTRKQDCCVERTRLDRTENDWIQILD
jgi:immunity protein 53 of polymorphic toxin system